MGLPQRGRKGLGPRVAGTTQRHRRARLAVGGPLHVPVQDQARSARPAHVAPAPIGVEVAVETTIAGARCGIGGHGAREMHQGQLVRPTKRVQIHLAQCK